MWYCLDKLLTTHFCPTTLGLVVARQLLTEKVVSRRVVQEENWDLGDWWTTWNPNKFVLGLPLIPKGGTGSLLPRCENKRINPCHFLRIYLNKKKARAHMFVVVALFTLHSLWAVQGTLQTLEVSTHCGPVVGVREYEHLGGTSSSLGSLSSLKDRYPY